MLDGLRHDDPGIDATRLAAGGAIDTQQPRRRTTPIERADALLGALVIALLTWLALVAL